MNTVREFITRLKKRDHEAFEQLYREKREMMYRYILYRVNGDTSVTEDIISEVFCDAIDYASSLTIAHNVQAWLFRITKSKIANYFRSLEKKFKWEVPKSLETYSLTSEITTPEFSLLFKEHRLMIHAAFSLLSCDQQEVLEKKYIQGMKIKKIAECIKKTEKAVESLLYRARREFQKKIQKLSNERIYTIRNKR